MTILLKDVNLRLGEVVLIQRCDLLEALKTFLVPQQHAGYSTSFLRTGRSPEAVSNLLREILRLMMALYVYDLDIFPFGGWRLFIGTARKGFVRHNGCSNKRVRTAHWSLYITYQILECGGLNSSYSNGLSLQLAGEDPVAQSFLERQSLGAPPSRSILDVVHKFTNEG